jgi:hypothetical protein
MTYRIIRGQIGDKPSDIREGWWWHSSGSPSGWDYGYAPEGPFITKSHARRHLWNTLRASRMAKQTGTWPHMPRNAGWCPEWRSIASRSTMKPLPNTRIFGKKAQAVPQGDTLT